MQLRLIRHATLLVEIAGRRLTVDPMLGEAGSAPPVEGSTNDRRNPLVALPLRVAELVEGLDGVLVTHTHSDHLDPAADEAFPHGLPLLCQPPDEQALRERGFADVRPVAGELDWDGLRVSRTSGRHGSGQIGDEMGPVSGFVLAAAGEPTLLIAGDTIWCDELRGARAAPARRRGRQRGRGTARRRRPDHDDRR